MPDHSIVEIPSGDSLYRGWLLRQLLCAYEGQTHALLTDLASQLGAGISYVDRPTIEAHLERSLSDRQWTTIRSHLRPMDFDEQVGEAGTLRTDWIEQLLRRAGVPGHVTVLNSGRPR